MELKRRLFFGFVAAGLVSISASAAWSKGGVAGGGGDAVVCYNTDGSIRSAELLDLFEARVMLQLSPLPLSGSLEDRLAVAASRYAEVRQNELLETFNLQRSELNGYLDTFGKFKFLPQSVRLKPIDDSLEVVVPSGCEIRQLANYRQYNLVLIDSEVWEKMDLTNRAALIVHEHIYRQYKMMGFQDSVLARKFVSHLFSSEKLKPVYDGIPEASVFCNTTGPGKTFNIWAYPTCTGDKCGTTLQITRLQGEIILSKTTVNMPMEISQLTGKFDPKKERSAWGLIESKISDGNFLFLFFDEDIKSSEGKTTVSVAVSSYDVPWPKRNDYTELHCMGPRGSKAN